MAYSFHDRGLCLENSPVDWQFGNQGWIESPVSHFLRYSDNRSHQTRGSSISYSKGLKYEQDMKFTTDYIAESAMSSGITNDRRYSVKELNDMIMPNLFGIQFFKNSLLGEQAKQITDVGHAFQEKFQRHASFQSFGNVHPYLKYQAEGGVGFSKGHENHVDPRIFGNQRYYETGNDKKMRTASDNVLIIDWQMSQEHPHLAVMSKDSFSARNLKQPNFYNLVNGCPTSTVQDSNSVTTSCQTAYPDSTQSSLVFSSCYPAGQMHTFGPLLYTSSVTSNLKESMNVIPPCDSNNEDSLSLFRKSDTYNNSNDLFIANETPRRVNNLPELDELWYSTPADSRFNMLNQAYHSQINMVNEDLFKEQNPLSNNGFIDGRFEGHESGLPASYNFFLGTEPGKGCQPGFGIQDDYYEKYLELQKEHLPETSYNEGAYGKKHNLPEIYDANEFNPSVQSSFPDLQAHIRYDQIESQRSYDHYLLSDIKSLQLAILNWHMDQKTTAGIPQEAETRNDEYKKSKIQVQIGENYHSKASKSILLPVNSEVFCEQLGYHVSKRKENSNSSLANLKVDCQKFHESEFPEVFDAFEPLESTRIDGCQEERRDFKECLKDKLPKQACASEREGNGAQPKYSFLTLSSIHIQEDPGVDASVSLVESRIEEQNYSNSVESVFHLIKTSADKLLEAAHIYALCKHSELENCKVETSPTLISPNSDTKRKVVNHFNSMFEEFMTTVIHFSTKKYPQVFKESLYTLEILGLEVRKTVKSIKKWGYETVEVELENLLISFTDIICSLNKELLALDP